MHENRMLVRRMYERKSNINIDRMENDFQKSRNYESMRRNFKPQSSQVSLNLVPLYLANKLNDYTSNFKLPPLLSKSTGNSKANLKTTTPAIKSSISRMSRPKHKNLKNIHNQRDNFDIKSINRTEESIENNQTLLEAFDQEIGYENL